MMSLTTYGIWYQGNVGLSIRDTWREKREKLLNLIKLALEDSLFSFFSSIVSNMFHQIWNLVVKHNYFNSH